MSNDAYIECDDCPMDDLGLCTSLYGCPTKSELVEISEATKEVIINIYGKRIKSDN